MTTAVIAFCLAAGYLIGHFLPALVTAGATDTVIAVLLYVMLFFVGLELGMKDGLRQELKKLGSGFVMLPLMAAAGSVGGGVLAGLMIGLQGWKGAAVGAGFGWYSLSSVMLARHDTALGAMAFLSNVARELLALLFIPILSRYIHPWAGIAAGGATSMDTTLPVVVRSSGSEYAIQSFVSGVILSMMAPAVISAILQLAGVE